MPVPTPPVAALNALLGGYGRVTMRCEMLDSSHQMFAEDVGIIDGEVTVDATRDERRMVDATLFSDDGLLEMSPRSLWYDKFLRFWRGVVWSGGTWEAPLGTFMVDTSKDVKRVKSRAMHRDGLDDHDVFPRTAFAHAVQISGRDRTKKMIKSKIDVPTTFRGGTSLDVITVALAANSGISPDDVVLPWAAGAAPQLAFDFTADGGATRWETLKAILEQFGYECFFDAYDFLVIRAYRDPATQAPSVIFTTGREAGNLVTYERSSNDTELFNRVVVRGSVEGNSLLLGEATITDPSQAAHDDYIGDRPFYFDSGQASTPAEARELAATLLRVKCLQSYQVDMGALVMPWLEASDVVSFFEDLAPPSADPTSFFMTNFGIPLSLSTMPVTAKRLVTGIGLTIPPPGSGWHPTVAPPTGGGPGGGPVVVQPPAGEGVPFQWGVSEWGDGSTWGD